MRFSPSKGESRKGKRVFDRIKKLINDPLTERKRCGIIHELPQMNEITFQTNAAQAPDGEVRTLTIEKWKQNSKLGAGERSSHSFCQFLSDETEKSANKLSVTTWPGSLKHKQPSCGGPVGVPRRKILEWRV